MSFNPCYDGIGSRSLYGLEVAGALDWFQSLLWWNWLTKAGLGCLIQSCPSVSILVMMELAHEVSFRYLLEMWDRRFYPCYDGIGSRSRKRNNKMTPEGRFQSLLWWNWLTKNYPRALIDWLVSVSILVMMELAHEVWCYLQWIWIFSQVSILVMMELAHEELRLQICRKKPFGFNPCYDGIGSRRKLATAEIEFESLFQSLLWWNWLTKSRDCDCDYWNTWFQSLLWWNWLTKYHRMEPESRI